MLHSVSMRVAALLFLSCGLVQANGLTPKLDTREPQRGEACMSGDCEECVGPGWELCDGSTIRCYNPSIEDTQKICDFELIDLNDLDGDGDGPPSDDSSVGGDGPPSDDSSDGDGDDDSAATRFEGHALLTGMAVGGAVLMAAL